ncbi:hypothetical protein NECAME_04037 [Necator americanus]|uniref:Uncharacterized protein n=1 Tax=Necator americanus TaxID=51031 RepID=W2SXV6_NECAM|nr:hypothetical protein NECAME_04037 [Necator americanus]ETN74358.1 hypothetical protein NECAME_04037 [Necator americanus]
MFKRKCCSYSSTLEQKQGERCKGNAWGQHRFPNPMLPRKRSGGPRVMPRSEVNTELKAHRP